MEGNREKEVDTVANEGKEARESYKQEKGEGEEEMVMKKGLIRKEEQKAEEGQERMEMKTGVIEGGEEEGRVDSYYQTRR